MKKFLFFLFFLIALGGTVFFMGWTQLTIPPGSYGVMRSKTHGLDEKIIKDGEFRWLWYKAIPTNAKISVFTLDKVNRSINSTGSLNSGQVYAALAGLEVDFSWEIVGDFSFNLKPEVLPAFTARGNITDNSSLRKAEETLALRIENNILEILRRFVNSENEQKVESLLISGSVLELNSEIEANFPEIENFSCYIRTVKYPDFALYLSLKDLHREYLERQKVVLAVDVIKEAEKRMDTRIRLDELSQYGELLTEFPVLLEYLALEKGLFTKTE